MANHPSSKKRIRQNEKRKVHNKYFARSTRNAIKELRNNTEKEASQELLPKVTSKIDKLAKMHQIHKNKASNLKAKLTKHVNSL